MTTRDWKELSITPKEFIAGVVFVFTMSGVWYKLYFENDNLKELQAKNAAIIDKLQERVRILEDKELQRRTLEDQQKEQANYSLKRVK